MKKYTWIILLLCLGTLAFLITYPLVTTNAAAAATDTRWPTVTLRATSTRWPLAPTATRWPSITVRPTDTRWPVAPTSSRWPTVTRAKTSTKWPTMITPPTGTRWPTAMTPPTSTHMPTLTLRATDTPWPTSPANPTATRWPTVTTGPTKTRTPTRTPTTSPTPTAIVASWLHYSNSVYGFEFYFPPDANITAQQDNYVQIYTSIMPGTNLVAKYLEVYATQNASSCSGNYGGSSAGSIVINGHSFVIYSGQDRGAGQIHEWSSYSTMQGTLCVSFNFILHSGNIDMFPAGTPVFNKTAESAVFTQILNTFTWLPTTPTPTPVSGLLMGPFAVVKVKSNDVLNIRSGAGTGYPVIGSFPYNASNVMRTGPVQDSGGVNWYQVQIPGGGTGWTSSLYLTEYVLPSSFCGDGRVPSLFSQLRLAVNSANSTVFASLVSPPRGVDVLYWHSGIVVNYTAAQAASIFTSSAQQNWGAGPSGTNTLGTFAAVVQPALQEVLNIPYESYCDNPKVASTFGIPWPLEYTNFNYYSLFKPGTPGVDFDYKQWMVGIDYVNGRPYISVLIRVVWEP